MTFPITLLGFWLTALLAANAAAQGISSVTRKTYKSPNPGFVVPATPPQAANQPGAAPARPAAPIVVYTVRRKPNPDAVDARVVEFQKTRAAEGLTYAQFELGMRYLAGKGVEQDEKTGREWLKKAAESGHVRAARKLEELDALAAAKEAVQTPPPPAPNAASSPK